MSEARKDFALRYAADGWAVFPLFEIDSEGRCTCGDHGRCTPGKHPRTPKGFKNATRDPARIEIWWTKWPNANIAIATGTASGIVVLDVDPRNSGDETLRALTAKHGPIVAPVVETGGKGKHYYLKYDPARPLPGHLGPGVEIKSDGGYVVAANSNHASGKAYEWRVETANLDRPPIPEWVYSESAAYKKKRSSRAAQPVEGFGTNGISASPETNRVASSRLFAAFTARGWLRRQIAADRWAVTCPWERAHTTKGETSTVIFAPPPGKNLGGFHCSHAHCERRGVKDVLAQFTEEELGNGAVDFEIDSDSLAGGDDDSFPTVQIGAVPDAGPEKWLVQNLWSDQAVGFIAGEPKSYKSFLSTALAVCVASGKPFLGRDVISGRVVLFNAEDRPALTRVIVWHACASRSMSSFRHSICI